MESSDNVDDEASGMNEPSESGVDYLQLYEERLHKLKDIILQTNDKYAVLCRLVHRGILNEERIRPQIESVSKWEGDSDFSMLSLVRVMYCDANKITFDTKKGNGEMYSEEELAEHKVNVLQRLEQLKQDIYAAMSGFPYWPAVAGKSPLIANLTIDEYEAKRTNAIVFWSENHLFMTLSAAYLMYQYRFTHQPSAYSNAPPDPHNAHSTHDTHSTLSLQERLDQRLEVQLLYRYLDLHLHSSFNGYYEALSQVYVPFTICALLNLIDLAIDPVVRDKARLLLDKILLTVMLGTDPLHGIANLTASARNFERLRLRCHGHNINQLVNLMNGHSPDPMGNSAIVPFLVLTAWRPNLTHFAALTRPIAMVTLRLSHSIGDTTHIHRQVETQYADQYRVHDSDWIPLYWSAGLVVHPAYVGYTRAFLAERGMKGNAHLWPLLTLTTGIVTSSMRHYSLFSLGHCYTNIALNVHKVPAYGLVMTSFERFNCHHVSYTSLPWMVNLAGAPLWSQSGAGAESVAGFGLLNTHNPYVLQRGGTMLVAYVAPPALTSTLILGSVFSYKVRLFWPEPLLDVLSEGVRTIRVEAGRGYSDQASRDLVTPRRRSSLGRMASAVFGRPSTSNASISEHHQATIAERVWSVGQRQGVYVAVLCTASVTLDYSDAKDAMFQPSRDSEHKVTLPRMVCEARAHSWVVVCGTRDQYASLEDFVTHRLRGITIAEEKSSGYYVCITDDDNEMIYSTNDRGEEDITTASEEGNSSIAT